MENILPLYICWSLLGYVTNWIALKMIFEPLNPVKVGPFMFQGLFLQRQKEVSVEFCNFISAKVLNSFQIWQAMLLGANAVGLKNIVSKNVNIPGVSVTNILAALKGTVGANTGERKCTHRPHKIQ